MILQEGTQLCNMSTARAVAVTLVEDLTGVWA